VSTNFTTPGRTKSVSIINMAY